MKINAMMKGTLSAMLLTGMLVLSANAQTKPAGHKEKKDTTTHRLPGSNPAGKPVKTTKKESLPPAKTAEPVKPKKN